MRLNKLCLLLTVPALLAMATPVLADACLDCHRTATPGAVAQWQGSAHFDKVSCAGCHGEDHQAMLDGRQAVDAGVCGRCHERAYAEHVASRHGLSLQAGWGCTRTLPDRDPRECRFCHEEGSTEPKATVHCARFLAQTAEMRSLGCNRCHQVESSCASCHTNHLTDLEPIRRPEACATCHMGPDHPQWEMWQTSRHGVLYTTMGEQVGPSCQTCHMPDGSHDVSFGITLTSAMAPLDATLRASRRDEMLGVCQSCHARGFAERDLQSSDAVRTQSVALVKEATAIVQDLNDRNLLVPAPSERPPHPLLGQKLVVDGQMLYEDYSHIERLLFKMKKYDLAKAVKGAYHQNPAYTHWYGNAELKLTLVDIKAEAHRLRGAPVASAAADGQGRSDPSADVEQELRALKNKYERGAIDAQSYASERARLLDGLTTPGR
ncbi:MAG: multiheme c-type cytochrome [Desulfuromonadales bacterium]|nr:multiheme c-type cytochrome [Desulfuromonadales bacterium]